MSFEGDILIDNYLKGLLSKPDLENFNFRLKSDKVFKENFELEKALWEVQDNETWSFIENKSSEYAAYKQILEQDDIKELKEIIKSVNSEQIITKKKTSRMFYYLAAASVVVFLSSQFFFNNKISNQDLYSEYVEINNLPSFATRSVEDSIQAQRIKGQSLFESKDYDDALNVFNSTLNTASVDANTYLYIGISQTELNLYSDAEKTFITLINSDFLDAEIGYWYKALLYLKQNKLTECKRVLNKILKEKLYNQKKARNLLNDLN